MYCKGNAIIGTFALSKQSGIYLDILNLFERFQVPGIYSSVQTLIKLPHCSVTDRHTLHQVVQELVSVDICWSHLPFYLVLLVFLYNRVQVAIDFHQL